MTNADTFGDFGLIGRAGDLTAKNGVRRNHAKITDFRPTGQLCPGDRAVGVWGCLGGKRKHGSLEASDVDASGSSMAVAKLDLAGAARPKEGGGAQASDLGADVPFFRPSDLGADVRGPHAIRRCSRWGPESAPQTPRAEVGGSSGSAHIGGPPAAAAGGAEVLVLD